MVERIKDETTEMYQNRLESTVVEQPGSVVSMPSGVSAALEFSGIHIKIMDDPSGHTVFITNTSDIPRTLEAIQPFKIYSGRGTVNLKQLFHKGSVSISQHSTLVFFVSDIGQVSNLVRWRSLVPCGDISATTARLQPVNVISSMTGKLSHAIPRQHLALFA